MGLAFDVIDIARNIISEYDQVLDLMPASDWTKQLQTNPTGFIIPGRKIMSSKGNEQMRYYDVTKGRFLTDDEMKKHNLSQ